MPADGLSFPINLVAKYVDKFASKLLEATKDQVKKIAVDSNAAFSCYLERSYDKYSKMKTILYQSQPKYLYDFFEPCTLDFNKRKVESAESANVVDISNYIIIEGTGGIGKSTLMKHLFLDQMNKVEYIPVFVELKDLNSFDGSFENFLYSVIYNLGFSLEKLYFEYALKQGYFIFLLDGYDELTLEKSNQFIVESEMFFDRYNNNKYIISSRTNDNFIKFERFSVLKILPLDKLQSISLISKIDYDEDLKKRFVLKLEESLYRTHTSFASNPLLLTIMLLTFENYAQVPEKLHLFYENAFETLYYKHDATKAGFSREKACDLSYDDFKKVFAKFCFRTYINSQIEFSKQELYDLIKKSCDNSSFNPTYYIKDIVNALCLMYEEGNCYRFTHRSFQEYFAALHIKDLTDENMNKVCRVLIKNSSRIFDEVLGMLSDMSQIRFERNVLIPILEDIEPRIEVGLDRYKSIFPIFINSVRLSLYNSVIESVVSFSDELRIENDILFNYYIISRRDLFGIRKKNVDKVYEKQLIKLIRENDKSTRNTMLKDKQYNRTGKIPPNIRLSAEKIIHDDDLLNYIKSTWIGEYVFFVSTALGFLEKKHTQSKSDLDELLSL